MNLYMKDAGKCSGLSLVPKLKYEHLHLTSFSKMRVDLAVQVVRTHFKVAYICHTWDLCIVACWY
jgi:hypothetical protein